MYQRGLTGEEAAVQGALAVSRPVIFAVLTTIVAFAPWLFVSGVTAQLTKQLSIVITLALVFSLIEAFSNSAKPSAGYEAIRVNLEMEDSARAHR